MRANYLIKKDKYQINNKNEPNEKNGSFFMLRISCNERKIKKPFAIFEDYLFIERSFSIYETY